MPFPHPLYIGILGAVIIIYVFSRYVKYFVVRKLVGVYVPCIYMEVGDTEIVKATLVYKPRWTEDFQQVHGNIFFNRGSGIFDIDGKVKVTKAGNPNATVTVRALNVGKSTLTVSGASVEGETAGDSYDPVTIHVEIVADYGNFLSLYRSAALKGTRHWFNGLVGNWLINTLKMGRKGLCDEWAEWSYDWVMQHNHCRIKRIEIVNWKDPGHDCARVTLWDGSVYYLDPHRCSDDPVQPKKDYEKKYGAPYQVTKFHEKSTVKPPKPDDDEPNDNKPDEDEPVEDD